MKKVINLSTALVLLIVSAGSFAFADGNGHKFYVDDPTGRNAITFKSEAPLEDIVGTTNQITGYINFNPDNPTSDGFTELTVPVASLNTGIPLRDEHMRSPGWLNADANPNIMLNLKSVKKAEMVKEMDNARTYELIVTGDFTLNGITKSIEFSARVTFLSENEMTKMRLPGNLLAVRAGFSVPLADYNITGPENMPIIGSKVSEEIEVSVNIMGTTTPPSMAQENK
jgi:polyisoprenoid-binding protein YceI